MTKKGFIALAAMIRDYNEEADSSGFPRFSLRQIQLLADFCYQQNEDFNRERWLGYVAGTNGPNGGTETAD